MGNFCSDCYSKISGGATTTSYQAIVDTRSDAIVASSSSRNELTNINGHGRPQVVNEITTLPQVTYNAYQPQQPSAGPAAPVASGRSGGTGFFIKYDLKEEVGLGSTSKCYKCTRKSDGQEFACKVIDKRQVEVKFSGLLDQFFVEIKVLKTLNHPHIIHLEDTFETPDRIYMVMEMMSGGELFDYVVEKGTLSEEEASLIVRKITSAVAHMHGLGIIHRDLKPENLLLTSKRPDGEVKIIDFGLAKELAENETRSFLGTRGYLAPEMLQRHSYDKAIDIWALGVIVFVLLCGCLPFDDDSSRIANETAARKKFALRFPRWAASLSASAKDLLHNLLDVNPKTRFTAEQALNHPWVAGRTVQANSYLQSPSMLGERRKELRSPLTPQVLAARMAAAAGGNGTVPLDAIKEESIYGTKSKDKGSSGGNGAGPGIVRKNSL